MYETQAELEAVLQRLYQFRLIKKLGEGAFGIAVLVFDEVEKEHKVFKFPKDARTTDALRQEGENLKALQHLSHPNIIRLNQYGMVPLEWNGAAQDRYYLNMAFGGTSLRAKLGPLRYELDEVGNAIYHGGGKALPPEDVLRLAIDCCKGLEAAHGFQGAAVRMLHRDISPDNILIDDVTGAARLSDFGIARVIDRSTAMGSIAGKLIYMDPECFLNRASFHSDLYSLAIVLYEALTGQLPFGNFQERMERPPRPIEELVPGVPSEFSALIRRALNPDVKTRYRNASEMLADLVRLRARLNPLPPRYQHLAGFADGRLLCEDRETGERVAVRILSSPATEAELAQQRRVIQSLERPALEASLRDFRNEHFLGIVSPIPAEPTLADRFPEANLHRVEDLKLFCAVLAEVCDHLDAAHQHGVYHGLLSPLAVTLPPSGLRVHELGLAPVVRLRAAAGKAEEFLEAFKSLLPFLSPQIRKEDTDLGPRDDVYSLGAILQFLLLGQVAKPNPPLPAFPLPVPGPEVHRDHPGKHLGDALAAARGREPKENPPRGVNPLLPERLLELIRRCVDPNPLARPGGLGEVAAILRACRWPEDAVEALCAQARRLYPAGGSPAALVEACARLDQALRLDPGNPLVHYTRGHIYFENGSYEWAAKDLDKAARVRPGGEVLLLLGEAYEKAGQPEQAETAYRKALDYGVDRRVLDRLAALANRKDPDKPLPDPAYSLPTDARESTLTLPSQHPMSGSPPCVICGATVPLQLIGSDAEAVCGACRSDPLGLTQRLLRRRGYKVLRELGRGGMGLVYLARDETTGEKVAVKTMHPHVAVGPRAREMFLREVENTKALHHANCVRLRDSWSLAGVFLFTLEYCAGGSVEELRKSRGGMLSLDEACSIILQALDGLHYAHTLEIPNARRGDGQHTAARGLVHRDLKPGNLFLANPDGNRLVKIGDFGLAKVFDLAGASGHTMTGMTAGTPYFMPRQQALDYKYAEPEVDVWAMAATLYYLLSGQPPRNFKQNKSKLQVVLEDDPIPLLQRCPTMPRRVAEVIDTALIDRPALMLKSAAAFKEMLTNSL